MEAFPLLDAGQRRTHDISREIAAAAPGDDAVIKSFFNQSTDLLCGKVMELQALASGNVGKGNVVFLNAVSDKL